MRELDVGNRCFQNVRSDLLALLDHFCRRFDDRGAAVHDRFRAAGAAAGQQLIAVALQQADAVVRDSEVLGQHLRERGRGLGRSTGDDGHGAVGLETDAAHLFRWWRSDLEEAADAEPAYLAALAARALPIETLGVGDLERLLEHAGKITAVVIARRHLDRDSLA
jgi:hypothetical protein